MKDKNIKEKIATIVVTYNRKELLKECLDSLIKQTKTLDAIYIIDNASTDGTPQFLMENGYIKRLPLAELENHGDQDAKIKPFVSEDYAKNQVKIHYVRMRENTGSSGGYYEGVKNAYEMGYYWLWLMDDDVKPLQNCLEILLSGIDKIYSKYKFIPWVVAPTRTYLQPGKKSEPVVKSFDLRNPFKSLVQSIVFSEDIDDDIIQIEGCSFEGPLISRRCIKTIGFPDKRFFIWADDTDYCLRIKEKGGKIFYIPEAKVLRLKEPRNMTYLENDRMIILFRNAIYLNLRYGSVFVKIFRPIFTVIKFCIKSIISRHFRQLPLIFVSLSLAYERYFQEYNYFK